MEGRNDNLVALILDKTGLSHNNVYRWVMTEFRLCVDIAYAYILNLHIRIRIHRDEEVFA